MYRRVNEMALLENEHIRLRALEPEDLDLLYRWENDTSQWNVGNTLSPFSRYILKEYIANSHLNIYELKQQRFMIELKPDGTAIGMIDLYDFEPHHRRAGVGIMLDRLYQGKGFAMEALDLTVEYAFSFLRLHQLYSHVPAKNSPSKALFERCGFILTSVLTDWIVTKEGYSDVYVMQRITTRLTDN